MDAIQEWITGHEGPDWAVLIIDRSLRTTYISEHATFRGTLSDPYGLAGIHVRDLLVVADPDTETWMPPVIGAMTAGAGSRHVPFTRGS